MSINVHYTTCILQFVSKEAQFFSKCRILNIWNGFLNSPIMYPNIWADSLIPIKMVSDISLLVFLCFMFDSSRIESNVLEFVFHQIDSDIATCANVYVFQSSIPFIFEFG